MHYIYVIQNKINNKIYVGQTINLKARWNQHKKDFIDNVKYCDKRTIRLNGCLEAPIKLPNEIIKCNVENCNLDAVRFINNIKYYNTHVTRMKKIWNYWDINKKTTTQQR